MLLLHATQKVCTPAWLEFILFMLGAFVLGYLLRRMFESNSAEDNTALIKENEGLRSRLEEAETKEKVAVSFGQSEEETEAIKSEVGTLIEELTNSKKANALLRARIEDLEEIGAASDIDEDVLKEEVGTLINELKAAKEANALLRARIEDLEEQDQKFVGATAAPETDTGVDSLKSEISDLVLELQGAKAANALLRARLEDVESNPPAAPMASGSPDQKDDLKKIEGIGPKIEELCNGIGVFTYDQLAFTKVADLRKMLADAGPRFKMHDPGTWPAQSSLAAQDLWDQLKNWQDALDGGKM